MQINHLSLQNIIEKKSTKNENACHICRVNFLEDSPKIVMMTSNWSNNPLEDMSMLKILSDFVEDVVKRRNIH